ncbi:hypothetical protein ACFSHT_22430 [Paraburkholderia silviterrae]|uniref:Uncharacterized protein n=1 Tax=Paraburkholderia silviterrae TaxID=2528715 RepID=A0A4R5MF89_9BURK|nr:hypothetical protein [Paraburkholderia silviterrae]TDG25862.1 hypothetical protein EYW47_00380 [Paraburkholderia silviterrae]
MRPLMPMPIHLALFVSADAYFRECRRLKINGADAFVPNDSNACCHYFENDTTGMTYAMVCVDLKKMEGKDGIGIASTIIHESVHIYQECLSYIGEKNPGDEFEAYSIQHIAEQLLRAYVELTS